MRKNSIFSSCKTLLHAFSLVELMISLITISLISAAFAPVITKKLKSSTITIGSGEVKMECSAFGPNCSLCYEDKCIVCYKSCADNEAVDIANCNCVACSDKHGASCLKCDIKNCSKCTNTNYIVDGTCTSCEAGYYCDGTTKESCPQGYYCSGGIKTPCPAGTYNDLTGKSLLSDCKTCASNTYSTEGASSCANNTALNCSTKSTTSNTCTSCNAGYGYSSGICTACASGKYSTGGTMACTSVTNVSNCATYSTTSNACTACNSGYKISNGNCVSSDPVYTLKSGGADITKSSTELTKDENYWQIKIKSSGTLVFTSIPTHLIDVFVVGGGAGGVDSYRSSTTQCSASAGGGGTYSFLRNVYISSGLSYSISIGSGGGGGGCSSGRYEGGTSSGFGIFSGGGINSVSYSICPFGEATCAFMYGNRGSATNQNQNTGNGGASGSHAGMSGAIIIRVKKDTSFNKEDKLPIYKLTNSGGANITNTGTSIRVTDTHWYLEIVKSGNLKFDSIKNDKIDVFLVGGGAGGVSSYRSSTTQCSASAGNGGNFNVLNNVDVVVGTTYPIVVGSGGGGSVCSSGRFAGTATSAFGRSAAGGSGATPHTVCLFNGADCTVTYGNRGSDTNQFQNTGNGGASAKAGMNGVVIIRGTL